MTAQSHAIALSAPLMSLFTSEYQMQPRFDPPFTPSPPPTLALASAAGKVEGKIHRTDGSAPIANARAFLASPYDPHWIAWAEMDDQASYSFADVQPGDYSLTLIWDRSGRFQDALNEIAAFSWAGNWLVTQGCNGVVVATASFTLLAGAVLHQDLNIAQADLMEVVSLERISLSMAAASGRAVPTATKAFSCAVEKRSVVNRLIEGIRRL